MRKKESQTYLPTAIETAANSLRQTIHEGHLINDLLLFAHKRNESAQLLVSPDGEITCAVGDSVQGLAREGTIFEFNKGKFFAQSTADERLRVNSITLKRQK